jgi:hypothetical protein
LSGKPIQHGTATLAHGSPFPNFLEINTQGAGWRANPVPRASFLPWPVTNSKEINSF